MFTSNVCLVRKATCSAGVYFSVSHSVKHHLSPSSLHSFTQAQLRPTVGGVHAKHGSIGPVDLPILTEQVEVSAQPHTQLWAPVPMLVCLTQWTDT